MASADDGSNQLVSWRAPDGIVAFTYDTTQSTILFLCDFCRIPTGEAGRQLELHMSCSDWALRSKPAIRCLPPNR